uniref:Reticulocyte-binding protein 2 like protein a n=1 Tax=Columba livia TaxID=8932 RepID=R7VWR6_COLLI
MKQTAWRQFSSRAPLFQFIASSAGAGPAPVTVWLSGALQSPWFPPGSEPTCLLANPHRSLTANTILQSPPPSAARAEKSHGTETLTFSIILQNRQLSVLLATIDPSFLTMSERNDMAIGYVFNKQKTHKLTLTVHKKATISVRALANNDYHLSPLWEQEQQRHFDKIPTLHQCFAAQREEEERGGRERRKREEEERGGRERRKREEEERGGRERRKREEEERGGRERRKREEEERGGRERRKREEEERGGRERRKREEEERGGRERRKREEEERGGRERRKREEEERGGRERRKREEEERGGRERRKREEEERGGRERRKRVHRMGIPLIFTPSALPFFTENTHQTYL